MDHGEVRPAPYPAVVALVNWVERRRNWFQFHGWCVSTGVADVARLRAADALSLIHFYLVKDMTDEKEYRKLSAQLTGPMLVSNVKRLRKIKERAPDEPPMPAWWDDDDEEASASSIAAARQLGI